MNSDRDRAFGHLALPAGSENATEHLVTKAVRILVNY